MATTIFQSSPNFKLGPGQNTFGPFNIPASVPYSEVVITFNLSQTELQDPTLSFTASFQLSTDAGVTWTTTDGMTWQGSTTPTSKTGGWNQPLLGFDSNTLALYAGNKMQVVTNAPNQITCQVTVVGQ